MGTICSPSRKNGQDLNLLKWIIKPCSDRKTEMNEKKPFSDITNQNHQDKFLNKLKNQISNKNKNNN